MRTSHASRSMSLPLSPAVGIADAEISTPSVEENPELKGTPFKAWIGQTKAKCTSHAARDFFLKLVSILPVHSPVFFPKPLRSFPVLAVANTGS